MNRDAIYTATIDRHLAPVKPYLQDPAVSEVMINAADEVFVERGGVVERSAARFADTAAYEAAVNNILHYTGKSLTDPHPLVDTRLPDGSRVHVAKTPCARRGLAMSIRKFSKDTLDVDWLVHLGSLTAQARDFLRLAVLAEQNVLVCGGTSSGKTSLLNALSRFIPAGQRIVTIEDSAELQLQQEHVVSLEAQPADRFGRGAVSVRELFRASLRLRPDRIVIGEVRGGEALDMVQAMTSGHGGSMGTLHANSPADALNRLETMAMMSGVELPLHALRSQVASAIDFVVHLSRQVGGRRLVTEIAQIDPLDAQGNYHITALFELGPTPGNAPNGPAGASDEGSPLPSDIASEEHGAASREVTLQWTHQRPALADYLTETQRVEMPETLASILPVETTRPAEHSHA